MALTQEQINQAYQIALGRTADAGGAQFYANSGMDYSTLMNTLQASQEYQQLNPNASSGIGFNQSGVREDQTQQYMMNSAAYDMGMSAQELNKIINPLTYDAVNYTPSGYMALTQPTTQWDTQSNLPVTLTQRGYDMMNQQVKSGELPKSYQQAANIAPSPYQNLTQQNFLNKAPSGYVSNAFPQYTPNYGNLTQDSYTPQQTNALMRPITPNSNIGGQQQQYGNLGYNNRRSSLWGDW